MTNLKTKTLSVILQPNQADFKVWDFQKHRHKLHENDFLFFYWNNSELAQHNKEYQRKYRSAFIWMVTL